jgi:diaminohydroxyphosphoribosylaminopyrimidine deaminase / 5-amino-6-(5-phosphoribosylamino)uracil reductase
MPASSSQVEKVWRRSWGPCGSTAARSLAARLIDRVVAYIAPVLIGGGGKPALAGPGALNIADAKRFQLDDVVRIGPDVRLTATPLM